MTSRNTNTYTFLEQPAMKQKNNDRTSRSRSRSNSFFEEDAAITAMNMKSMFRSVSMATPPSVQPPKLLGDSPPHQGAMRKTHSLPNNGKSITKPVSAASSAVDSKWSWKLTPGQLLSVPIFHPLERTAVTINDVELDTVTARISNFLREMSIRASYRNEDGSIDCMTENLLKFIIQLWKGANGIVVEIQRRQGDAIQMQRIRTSLIRAIRDTNEHDSTRMSTARYPCRFELNRTSIEPPHDTMAHQEHLSSALLSVKRMLSSPRLDENRLGLESLCILTDSSSALRNDAIQVSRTILSDTEFQTLLSKYFTHIESVLPGETTGEMKEEYDDDEVMYYEQGQFFGCLHFLALKAVCNALEMCCINEICLDEATTSAIQQQFWATILQALYYDLKIATLRPLEASLSIRCLRLLQSMKVSNIDFVAAINQERLYERLVVAHQFGTQYSSSLEQETKTFLSQMGYATALYY